MLARRINFAMVGAGVSHSVLRAACDTYERCGDDHYVLVMSDRQNPVAMAEDVMRILGVTDHNQIQQFDLVEVMQAGYVFGHLQRLAMHHPEMEIHVFLDLPNHMQFGINQNTGVVDLIFDDGDATQNIEDFLQNNPNVNIELATMLMTPNGVVRSAEAIERKRLADNFKKGNV